MIATFWLSFPITQRPAAPVDRDVERLVETEVGAVQVSRPLRIAVRVDCDAVVAAVRDPDVAALVRSGALWPRDPAVGEALGRRQGFAVGPQQRDAVVCRGIGALGADRRLEPEIAQPESTLGIERDPEAIALDAAARIGRARKGLPGRRELEHPLAGADVRLRAAWRVVVGDPRVPLSIDLEGARPVQPAVAQELERDRPGGRCLGQRRSVVPRPLCRQVEESLDIAPRVARDVGDRLQRLGCRTPPVAGCGLEQRGARARALATQA